MKIKITKESTTFYRRPIVIALLSLLLYYALNHFIAAPRLASEATSAQSLQTTRASLAYETQRLAELNKTGLAGINANYSKIATLDKLVPQLPSETVKANLLAEFIQLTTQTGTNGTLSFTGAPASGTGTPTTTSTGTATIPATFNVQGSSAQVIDFMSKLLSLSPLVTIQTASYVDVPSKTGDAFTASGSLLVIGSSNAAIPLDASGNPPAPITQ